MKVVCDACQAKYQIPDERVSGRKLKIRCRKCGSTILVRGDADTARATFEPPPEMVTEWHVSLQGDQHGPYPTEQMSEMLRGGQLSWDAYVWRESYGDWKMAGDSDTLVKAVAHASGSEETPTAAVVPPAAALPSQPGFEPGEETPTRMMQSSPGFHDELRPAMRSAFAARAQSQPPAVAVGSDVARARDSQPARMVAVNGGAARASQASQPATASGSYAPGSAAVHGRVNRDAAMTGERHEDSVLFSAGNLVATPRASTPSRPGYAAAEGSGLIDIRALAALTRSNANAPAPVQPNGEPVRSRNTQEEIFRLANQTGAFGKLDSVAPIDRPSRTPNSALPLAIFGGSAMIAIAGLIAVILLRPQPQPQAVALSAAPTPVASANAEPTLPRAPEPSLPAAQQAAPEPSEGKPSPEMPHTASAAKATDTSERDKAASVAAAKIAKAMPKHGAPATATPSAKVKEPKSDDDVLGLETKPAKATKKESAAASEDAKPAKKESPESLDDVLLADKPAKPSKPEVAAPAPAATPAPKGKRSIDDLLDDAVDPASQSGNKKAAAAEAASAALPDAPSRDQVLAAMHGVEPDVKACAEGQALDAPTAMVAISVAGSTGKVSSTRVTGVTGPAGSCIARAVRNASFPKFARESFSINFPFRLK